MKTAENMLKRTVYCKMEILDFLFFAPQAGFTSLKLADW
jgi:hypothetical protein